MKVSEMIACLSELQAKYGDVEVLHHDHEWGLGEAGVDIRKIVKEYSSDVAVGERSIELWKENVSLLTDEYIESSWKELEEDDRKFYKNFDEYAENLRNAREHSQSMLEQVETAPFAIVI